MTEHLHESRGRWLLESALELQARIEEELNPDYLLVDARTGVTELGGLATTALANLVVILFTPHRESWEGAAAVYSALREAPALEERTRRFELLLTRVQEGSPQEEKALSQIFRDYTVLPQDPLDGGAERAIGGDPRFLSRSEAGESEPPRRGQSLVSASLKWMARAFPRNEAMAVAAMRRMEAVDGPLKS